MRNNIIKRRLEYSMLGGILFNFISLFIPIINLTLTSETKQYTEGYSVGSLIKFLVPAVLNGDKGELSNPPLSLMAFLLFGLICWIASLFTLVLVFQSMRARKVNIFRTIAVSIFELLTALFFLVFSAQMKTFAIKVAVEPYFGNIRTGFNFLGLVPILVVIVFSFVNIYMLLGIIKRGEEYDEIDEEKDEEPEPRRPEGRRAPSSLYPSGRPSNAERPRAPRAPIDRATERPAERPAERTNIYSGEGERPYTEQRRPASRPAADPYRTRPISSTGVIDRDHLPKPNTSATRPAASAPATITCEKCGEKCRKGSRFCNICGEPLAAPVKKCKICGEILSERDVFCPSCGANIR
ncbi:MAG: zinc-ribbon domain-containing protein [Clostridia bacterium]|nr:zinc-ribbon domain-containing protein [Clostridia bacterium]